MTAISANKPEAKGMLRRVAMLGGTFDPIHYGHLRCAWELKESLGLDQVRLIPCHRPVHRDHPETRSEQRLAMVQLALQDADGLVADDQELRRHRPSYSLETLQALRQELGEQCCLVMAIGTDAFASLSTWHGWRQLLNLCHIVVMMRPGACLPTQGVEAKLLQQHRTGDVTELGQSPAGRILPLEVTALDISATAIRQQIAQGREPRFLLPDLVWRYIKDNHLYLSGE